jgi:YVTN family beta-propeller protein
VLSRRAVVVSAVGWLGCRQHKATGYPGYCFVANEEGRSLAVVDLSSFRTWPPVALPAAPMAVLPHPRQAKCFALVETGALLEVDVSSLSISRRARSGNQALGMRLAPDGDALWVLYREPAALVEFPLDTLAPRRRIALNSPPDAFDLTSADYRAAVASEPGQTVTIVSLHSAAVERIIKLGTGPRILSFQQKGAQIIVGSPSDSSLTMMDVSTGKVLVRLPVPIRPRHFCFSTDEGQLFVTGEGKDAVVIVYPYNTEVGETILAGHAPGAMAVAGNFLMVTNPETNSVTVLDTDLHKLVAVVQVGQEPREILITPDNQYALVLNQKSGDLAVIRIAALNARERVRRYKSAPLFTLIPVGQKPVSAAVVKLS